MYVSHPVRRLRADPHPDRTVRLAVEVADDDLDLAAVVADLGGRVVRESRFTTTVALPETAVDALCEAPGLARVETANTLGHAIDPDAVDDEGGGGDDAGGGGDHADDATRRGDDGR